MKYNKIIALALAGFMAASCSDIDNQLPEGGALTSEQVQDATSAIPERTQATFTGMFAMMGKPHTTWPTGGNSSRADDFGFISAALSLDLEGSDMVGLNSDYNWFSTASELSTREANYANPYMRYVIPYRQIGLANQIIDGIAEDAISEEAINMRAQACAIRAFDYMSLAPYFQFADAAHFDEPCIPLLDGKHGAAENPRASVREVYQAIIADLNWAVEHLTEARADKSKINKNVAYGLRARANLFLGNFAEAAADADSAMVGYQPATMEELGEPAFYNINDHNWIWGIIITEDMAMAGQYCTSGSWISPFSANSYAAYAQLTPQINTLLYNLIPATDVRKNWWIDENLYSPLLDQVSWNGVSGAEISSLTIDDVKDTYLPYTNVKFGMKSGVGSEMNNNDWPLMRVEEMILIKAEGLIKSGSVAEGTKVLVDFVKTYRNPEYELSDVRTIEDEVWMQRRIELWGEGFATGDIKRLGKPIVRFHENQPIASNFPDAFKFNVKADDGWLNMRFPQTEKDNNKAIVDNEGGQQPVPGQNPELLDGVTD